jgi:hypothetical protein
MKKDFCYLDSSSNNDLEYFKRFLIYCRNTINEHIELKNFYFQLGEKTFLLENINQLGFCSMIFSYREKYGHNSNFDFFLHKTIKNNRTTDWYPNKPHYWFNNHKERLELIDEILNYIKENEKEKENK